MSDTMKGVLAMVAATMIWGLSSIYYKLLVHVPPLEVLAHRTLWSFIFFAIVLMFRGRLFALWQLLWSRDTGKVALGAVMISTNWFFFIFSIQNERALEASLGYYIFPLVAVLLGVVFFRETLGGARAVAVGLAVAAVLILTIGLGVAPWISLVLAFSFGLYGAVKKGLAAGPQVSVTAEVALLVPLALGYLWFVWSSDVSIWSTRGPGAVGQDMHDVFLLMFSGILTGTPLILFSFAAQRLSYGLVGLMQYINPTLQFLVATLIFVEPFTIWHMVALPLIWAALALYSVATFRQERAASSRVVKAGTSGT